MAKKPFVNPLEKARKRAKKNEAKKQRKQRIEARSLNLKGKDVHVIIAELERLDQIQYNIKEAPKLNVEVIENKRKKLKKTLSKIIGLYKKEDQVTYDQIRRLEMNYEGKRANLIKRYEAVNSAKQVNLEEIPLPFCGDNPSNLLNSSTSCHRPCDSSAVASSTEQHYYVTISGERKSDLKPPGCPALLPPSVEELEKELKLCGKCLDSVNAEKDLDEFLKEVDWVERQVSLKEQAKELPTAPNNNSLHNLPKLPIGMPPIPMLNSVVPTNRSKSSAPINPSSSILPNPINPAPFPVLLDPMGLLNVPTQINRPSNAPPSILMNAPAPPFKHLMASNPHLNRLNPQTKQATAVIASQMRKEPEKVVQQQGATIEAKPKLRNLSADVIKFLPTSLRIKRQPTNKKMAKATEFSTHKMEFSGSSHNSRAMANPANNKPSKDAAYEEFMKELSGLI